MMSDEVQARLLTRHLWDESHPERKALADALRRRGLDPQQAAVEDMFDGGGPEYFGLLVTVDGEEFNFVIGSYKGRWSAAVTPLADPAIYSDALDAAHGILKDIKPSDG